MDSTDKTKVAFIGLGVMGYPMAGHLAKAGHDVVVYNRTHSKAEAWIQTYPGQLATTPREAASGADFVCICVGNDDDLRSVVLGEQGALAGMKPGAVIVDHTTVSATVERELGEAALNHGVGYVDAPVSGGQSGAEKGCLTVFCGGREDDVARATPVMKAYSAKVTRFGEVGRGQLVKMVNQICLAGCVQGLAEGLNFAERAGLDAHRVVEALNGGAASSWQMSNRGHTMVDGEFNFGFAVDWMVKDLGIALAEAARNGSSLPVASLVKDFYEELQASGHGRCDTSSLIIRLHSKLQ